MTNFDEDNSKLSHIAEDFGLAKNLAEMQRLFHEEAVKYGVYPLDDRAFERLNPIMAGRPDLMFGRTELRLYPGMTGMAENSFINTKAVLRIEADVTIPEGAGDGVILPQAGFTGGWSLPSKTGGRSTLATGSRASNTRSKQPNGSHQARTRSGSFRLRRRRTPQGRHRSAVGGRGRR